MIEAGEPVPPPSRPSQRQLFATTRWTLIQDAVRGSDAEAVAALWALFATCWPLLYR